LSIAGKSETDMNFLGASVLGLILARGGSKRVPRKNLRTLGGFPLISWTIGAAQRSQAGGRGKRRAHDLRLYELRQGAPA